MTRYVYSSREEYEELYNSDWLRYVERTESEEYNLRKMVNQYYLYQEENEKDAMIYDLMRDFRKLYLTIQLGDKKTVSTIESKLVPIRNEISSQNWKTIISLIDRLIRMLQMGVMPSSTINKLILATDPTGDIIGDDVLVSDVLNALNTHLKDIKVNFDINRKYEALDQAKRCREILTFAERIKQIAKEEGLEPLKASELVEIDEYKGKKIYKLREEGNTQYKSRK